MNPQITRAALESLEARQLFSTTFTVTSVSDAGPGTLRDAIDQANASPGADAIAFGIGAGGATTIKPATPLPDITDPVTIDGTTQPGFNVPPIVRLDGDDLTVGSSPVGLRFAEGSSGSTLRGLSIHRFAGAGVRINTGVSGVTVAGNWIGLTDDGTGSFTQSQQAGVNVAGSDNVIGGADPADRNVISGNLIGIALLGDGATGNAVRGNFIGTSANGTVRVANQSAGVLLFGGASDNVVGSAAGTSVGGNVVAGNGGGGIAFLQAHDNVVRSNLIGLLPNGEALPNAGPGVNIGDHSAANTIGGTDGNAANAISGNNGFGVQISGGSDGNKVQGNRIGTDIAGDAAVPNGSGGVLVESSADNVIGGDVLGATNVISGNGGAGVTIVNAQRTAVQGNRIGTNLAGTAALGNVEEGVFVGAGSLDTTIGGTTPGAGNLVSGNSAQNPATHSGITVSGTATNRTVIQGNLIGTDVTGTLPLSSGQFAGVRIEDTAGNGASNLIGGDNPVARNVISGNKRGVYLSNANDVRVFGNYIGTDVTGNAAVPNLTGVEVTNQSEFNDVGEIGNPAAGNVISGNTGDGIFSDAAVNDYSFNRIGTNAAGDTDLGNGSSGIHATANGNDARDNLISGNGNHGYFASNSGPVGLFRNRIGTSADGTAKIGNGGAGVLLANAGNSRIGLSGSGNLISGNAIDGVRINDSDNVKVQGNLIGTDVTGTKRLGNGGDGVFLGVGTSAALIGGTAAGAGNVISGNSKSGIDFAGADNENIVQGNKIGTDVTGTAALGNFFEGIHVVSSSSNLIGGSVPEAANTIAFNSRAGVVVNNGTRNAIRHNSIFSNGLLGIDLNGDGLTPNDAQDTDTDGNHSQNFPVLTSATSADGKVNVQGAVNSNPNKALVLDFYANTEIDGIGGSEGRTFIGSASVITDANGNATFNVTFDKPVAAGQFVTATANLIDTDPFADTSEFSAPLKVAPPKPALSITDVTAVEGKNGSKAFTFTVTLSAPSTTPVTVNFATQDGTATKSNKDYAAAAGTLTFAAGQTSRTITVQVSGDNKKELDEVFFVNLTNAVNADVADGQGVGTIKNDD